MPVARSQGGEGSLEEDGNEEGEGWLYGDTE